MWARQGNTEEIISRLSEFKLLPKIKEYAESRAARIGGWNNVVLSSIFNDKNKLFEGKNIMSAAKQKGVDEFEFIRNLLVEERNRVSIIGFAMSEDNLRKILSHELLMIGSDGNAVSTKGKLSHGKPHPRYYGTFPRILGKYVRDEKLFDLATGIKKMTSMPAEKLGLNNRGKLKKGYYADLVLFNPNEIIDKSTFTEPHQLADGIKYVLVNGKVSIENGVHSGELKGRIIRHKDT